MLKSVAVAVVCLALSASSAPQSASLGGEQRYQVHVSTDKAIYHVGDTVYVRGVVLETHTRTPLANTFGAEISIRGPKGDVVTSGWAQGTDATVGLGWTVPAEQAGGEYTVQVRVPEQGCPPGQRKFDIRVYQPPRLNQQITFQRDGYGPGDTVTATLHSERAEGGIPNGAKVHVSAQVDGVDVYHGSASVDAQGNATTRFALPKHIAKGDGTLAMAVEDGGVVETASKTLPILLQSLDLHMYPEGGDLVAGLPGRVYIEARTPAQKPADLAANVVDEQGHVVTACRTEHEGRGRCSLTPQAGRTYTLHITEPAGIAKTYPLPPTQAQGAVLSAVTDAVGPDGVARLMVGSNMAGSVTLTVRRQEVEMASTQLTFGSGVGRLPVNAMNPVGINLPVLADGVLTVTLWDEHGKALAERLVFRHPAEPLRVQMQADRKSYQPGNAVKVDLTTTDAHGRPVSAVVGLTATDDSIRDMQETRDQAPRLPVMVLLEPEVRELADAQIYFDPNNAKAPLAVDLLLGTQGWRRFALVDVQKFLADQGDAGRRAVAYREPPPPPPPAPPPMAAMGGAMNMEDRPAPPAAPAPVRQRMAARPPMRAMPPGAPPAAAPRVQPVVAGKPMAPAASRAARNAARAPEMAKKRAKADVAKDVEEQREYEPQQSPTFATVREYAHAPRPGRQPDERSDFTETLYWNAAVRTDAHGKASIEFGLSDAVTTVRLVADAFSGIGQIGAGTLLVQSVQPFYVESKMPLAATEGDIIHLPVSLINNTAYALADGAMAITLPAGLRTDNPARNVDVPAGGRARQLVRIDTAHYVGHGQVEVAAHGGNYHDSVSRPLAVEARGFPVVAAQGGVLAANGNDQAKITVAQDALPSSMHTQILVYPSPMARLTQALERLLREPYGCFEQTSSTSYPLTMAQQYFTSHSGVDAAIMRRGSELLTRSYQRLVGFECQAHGYEWFGGEAPGHEALTAYGVMQFADMQRAGLQSLDSTMMERTRTWLLARRDHHGGFARNQRALDSFGGAPTLTTNAYILWALLSAGSTGLQDEVHALRAKAMESPDSYVQALTANVLYLAGDKAAGKQLASKLVAAQDAQQGFVTGAQTSITRSGGDALRIETTALALLAWLQDKSFAAPTEQAMRYLASVCEDGRFASTQATVLALKAIVAYDHQHAGKRAPGSVQLLVDSAPVGQPVPFKAAEDTPIALPDAAALMTPGPHTLMLRMQDGSTMPYSISVNYHAGTPASAEQTKLTLSTALGQSKLREGETTSIGVTVRNLADSAAAMPVAIIGIPGGLEPRHDQLKELVKAGRVSAYEVRGREVVLYWRQLGPGEQVSLPVSLVAAVPGHYTAPASRAYEYYNDAYKVWVPGLTVDAEAL